VELLDDDIMEPVPNAEVMTVERAGKHQAAAAKGSAVQPGSKRACRAISPIFWRSLN
jgi:hypothetical protein